MRITGLLGTTALLAVAAACLACGPMTTPETGPAVCNQSAQASGQACPAPMCRTTIATRADLGQPPCCGVPGAPCTGQAKCGNAVSPASAGGCCVVMPGGKACCVPCAASVAPDGKPTIEGSLAKLEALKAKQAEIEAEVKKEQEVLQKLLEEARQRASKVGVGMPTVPSPGGFVPPPPAHQPPGPTAPRGPHGYSVPLAPTPAPSNPAPFNSTGSVPYGTPSPMYPVVAPHYGATSSTPPGPSAPPSPAR